MSTSTDSVSHQTDPHFIPPGPSRSTRNISTRADRGRGRGHLIGNGHQILADSILELKAAYTLLAHPDVVDVREQPPAVRWHDGDRWRTYTFDFVVTTRDGQRRAIEVKPVHRAARARETVAQVASYAPPGFAETFHVITDAELCRDAVHDARLIHAMRKLSDEAVDAPVAALISSLSGTASIHDLVGCCKIRPAAAFGAIIRAIGSGALRRVSAGRLSYATIVARGDH